MKLTTGVLAITVVLSACSTTTPAKRGKGAAHAPAPRGEPIELSVDRAPLHGQAEPSSVLLALQREQKRFVARFAKTPAPRPYFVGYEITDRASVGVSASLGVLADIDRDRGRILDVEVRVGSYQLDDTHPLRGDRRARMGQRGEGTYHLPLDDDPAKLRPTIWLATEKRYREARDRYIQVQGNRAVKAADSDAVADFSREKPLRHLQAKRTVDVDLEAWKRKVKRYSALFRAHPQILGSRVSFRTIAVNRYLTNSEGTVVQRGRSHVRLSIVGHTRTKDGMDLTRHEAFDASTIAGLAGDETIVKRVERVIADLEALRRAPRAEPYVGPAIIEGPAAGVYFHEIFGHRVEGHRQKDDEEGQTFAKQIGKRVMPAFVDVYDDPTIRRLNGTELNGFYRVDDQGVAAQRAVLVDDGVLRGFLLSRSPVVGFSRSNGHGRRQEGRWVVARQGNLIVEPRRGLTEAELKRRLIAEVRRQKKPYGLRFTVVQGGYTTTRRMGVQSFKVRPVMVYRVYPDGREQLVRGADIEGTPLTSLSQILAAGREVAVFNGYCGAESGMVPVAAASPSLLVKRVEIALKASRKERPPILPAPPLSSRKGAGR